MRQDAFEREVLFSLMKDAVNILVREVVRPRGQLRVETSAQGWDDERVAAYLPIFAASVPLKETSIIPANPGEEAESWLLLPQELVRPALQTFLARFVDQAVASGRFEPETNARIEPDVSMVADQVTRMWDRIGV